MKIGTLMAVGLCVIPAAGIAQQSTTTCSGSVVSVTCNSTTTPSLGEIFARDAEIRAAKDAQRAQSLDARTSEVEQFAAQQRALKLTTKIGQMISEGHCKDAKNEALSVGDLDLAVKAKLLCEEK